MGELRSFSTRARITTTSFVNDYSWGSFKGDADAWMEKYFDEHLTSPTGALTSSCCACLRASWTRGRRAGIASATAPPRGRRMERPSSRSCPRMKRGATGSRRRERAALVIGLGAVGAGAWRSARLVPGLAPVRAESVISTMTRSSRRSLPASHSSAPHSRVFAEFLRIDTDLVGAAAAASQPLVSLEPKRAEVRAWLAKLPAAEKDDLLTRLVSRQRWCTRLRARPAHAARA